MGSERSGFARSGVRPNFSTTGVVYVSYTGHGGAIDLTSRISRFVSRDGGKTLDPDSEEILLSLEQPYVNHNGGNIQFGPDGLLYVSTGMGDDPDASQDPASPRGKLLRLDPRVRPARPEVVALGLRNPWRFAFDRGRIWIGDVGERTYEEVDVLPRHAGPGVNFGWPAYEGFRLRAGAGPPGVRMPALVHRHGAGWCSVVGGYVARGRAPRVLHGRYVYADLCSGRLWSARLRGTSLVDDRRLRIPPVFSPVSFGEDARGRLYVVSLGGDVFRLAVSGHQGG